jgi:hypothetical protein
MIEPDLEQERRIVKRMITDTERLASEAKAGKASCANLSIDELAGVVAGLLREQQAELNHLRRRVMLLEARGRRP